MNHSQGKCLCLSIESNLEEKGNKDRNFHCLGNIHLNSIDKLKRNYKEDIQIVEQKLNRVGIDLMHSGSILAGNFYRLHNNHIESKLVELLSKVSKCYFLIEDNLPHIYHK